MATRVFPDRRKFESVDTLVWAPQAKKFSQMNIYERLLYTHYEMWSTTDVSTRPGRSALDTIRMWRTRTLQKHTQCKRSQRGLVARVTESVGPCGRAMPVHFEKS